MDIQKLAGFVNKLIKSGKVTTPYPGVPGGSIHWRLFRKPDRHKYLKSTAFGGDYGASEDEMFIGCDEEQLREGITAVLAQRLAGPY